MPGVEAGRRASGSLEQLDLPWTMNALIGPRGLGTFEDASMTHPGVQVTPAWQVKVSVEDFRD